MLVMNHQARHHRIPKAHHQGAADHEEITLAPGLNDVDDASWEEAKSLPVIKAHLRLKDLEEVKGANGKPAKAFAKLPEETRVDLAKEVNDPELLKDLSKGAKGETAKALAEQGEKLAAKAPPEQGKKK